MTKRSRRTAGAKERQKENKDWWSCLKIFVEGYEKKTNEKR